MAYSPVKAETFGGLNLVNDPGEVGWGAALDATDVDLDYKGRVRSRDGYTSFVAPANYIDNMIGYYKSNNTRFIVCSRSNGALSAITTGGSETATQAAGAPAHTFVRWGDASAEYIFAANGTDTVRQFDGSSWTTPGYTGVTPDAFHVGVLPGENRLVCARFNGNTAGDNASTVRFSDAGTPTTFGTNNYVDLHPGDGEVITGVCAWRDLFFVFKESKAFVFYGTSTDSSGNPVFNYRAIVGQGIPSEVQQGAASRGGGIQCVAAPHGVYFANRRGVWLTSGGPAELISRDIDPIYLGTTHSFYSGSYLNKAWPFIQALWWHGERLHVGFPEGANTTNNAVLVHDPARNSWVRWVMPASCFCSFRVSASLDEDLFFAPTAGTKAIYRYSSSYTDNNGSAISSSYRVGFSDLGSPDIKSVREWVLTGSGSPTFKTSLDFGSLDSGASVTLGTAPSIAEGRRRYTVRGRRFSWRVDGTSAWSLNSVVANVREKRAPGVHASA